MSSKKIFFFLFLVTTFILPAQNTTPVDTVPTPIATDPTTMIVEPVTEKAAITSSETIPAGQNTIVIETTPASQNTISLSELSSTTTTISEPSSTVVPEPTTSTATVSEPSSTVVAEPSSTIVAVPEATASPSKPVTPQIANIKTANLLYKEKAYAEAIPYYEKARQADNSNKMILSHLGDCYRLTKNLTGQLHAYGELVRSGNAEPIHELYYGQALMENGEAEKAKLFFEKYNIDERGKQLASSIDKIRLYTKNADAYLVTLASFNSPENDICAVKYNEGIVFASTRNKIEWIKRQQGWTNGNFMHLYTVKKAGSSEPPVIFMSDLKSKFNDGPVCFSKDFNTIYFTRNNNKKADLAKDGTYKLKILEASLDQNGFNQVKSLPFNNKNYNFAHPALSPDGYTLYFASDKEGGKGGMDIYQSKKDSSGVWGAPENLGDVVNSAGSELFPYMSQKGMLYFSSDGHDGLGGLDIYEVKIKNGKAIKIYNMGEPVNSKNDDFGVFLNEDSKVGYLTSNRKSGGMDDDIYDFQILREVRRGKEVTILTKDKETGQPIPNAKLIINGDSLSTNEKGEYALNAEEEAKYTLEAIKEDYFKKEDTVTAGSSPEDSFTKELVLEKDPKLFLRALITDSKTNDLLEGVTIKVIDIETNSEIDNYTTTSAGDYFKFLWGKRIGDKLAYLIKIEKPGYLQRSVVFAHSIDKPGEINLNETLNLTLGKVAVGMDLAKMIDIKPIYFDLGKSVIRPDAALELDKVVQVMNEYPNMFIELGAHTDCRSSAASNMKLSSARAKASAGYIVKRGINKMRIVGKGYGESKLLNNCACEGKVQSTCPEEEHDKNRRTEFLITKLK